MELTQDDVIRILKLIEQSPMGRVSLQIGDLSLEVTKATEPGSATAIPARQSRSSATSVAETQSSDTRSVGSRSEAREQAERLEPDAVASAAEDLLEIKAPILGVFYRQPQPGAPPYVDVGSLVDENTTVGLIEVMKLFNQVKADVKGRIKVVCAKNNELVEYGQVLFLVKPE